MKIFDILKCKTVTRLHCYQTHRSQNLADHQWGVAMWLMYIMQGRMAKHLHEAMIHALMHDVGEVAVGDIPSPTKRLMPDQGVSIDIAEKKFIDRAFGPLPDIGDDADLVRVADLLDLMHYCLTERLLGNKTLEEVFARADVYIEEIGASRSTANPWIAEAVNKMNWEYYNA